MENSQKEIVPHSQLLESLFAFKSKVSKVFRDVLGIHDIHHIALTRINKHNQLLTLSSTPAMEFNLFNSFLWQYDLTYNPKWFKLCTQNDWHSLYNIKHYDELYYLKQIKHGFPIGLSLATKMNENYVIYSIASHKSCAFTREVFSTHQEDFYKIGQYCSNLLHPLFSYYEDYPSQHLMINSG
ncbi:hypothetical protein OQJ02_13565 [Legionella sp. PATHC032]|uniref:hypothetical protein n=1 Tax=Legionella sp. PATHC032 TaxID=2992039 RepID=UPI001B1A0CCD|nr:hypothetical protein [Legionella sp. PATHC032]MCW8422658.1 hypothetical protein [Legionella sp. PATHC032]HAZ7572459.1 hypothetical protein [Legionella pneumophila]HBA1635596.1 hypothetical protein [Legionella pneumophila]